MVGVEGGMESGRERIVLLITEAHIFLVFHFTTLLNHEY